jgi:hypothetical protein
MLDPKFTIAATFQLNESFRVRIEIELFRRTISQNSIKVGMNETKNFLIWNALNLYRYLGTAPVNKSESQWT